MTATQAGVQAGDSGIFDASFVTSVPQLPHGRVTFGAERCAVRRWPTHVDRQLREQNRRCKKAYASKAPPHCSQVH
jgi:hypothetical protein